MRKLIIILLVGIFTSCGGNDVEEIYSVNNCAEFKGYRIIDNKRTYEFLLQDRNVLIFVSRSDMQSYLAGGNQPPFPKVGDVVCSPIFKNYF